MSLPLKKKVSVETFARTAKPEEDEAIVESNTVITREKVDSVIDNGDTASISWSSKH